MVKTDNFQLRYANCWEDTEVLLQHINRGQGTQYLSIASGGENSLSLLCLDPERVHVVDVNPLQLYLLELKMAAIQHLEWETCKAFLGYTTSEKRLKTYQLIKASLSNQAQGFWDKRTRQISKGVIYDGRVERNFKWFATFMRLIHSEKTCATLLAQKSTAAQIDFYNQHWNSKKWRFFFKLFFSNRLLKFIAPDPDFFNYIDQDVSSYLFDKTAQILQTPLAQNNYVLHYALFGHFGNCHHHFIQEENFRIIKNRLSCITMETGFFQQSIYKGQRFDGFNLSNIFEYTTLSEFEELRKALELGGNPNARYVYWNILVPRSLSVNSTNFNLVVDSSKDIEFQDRVWVYFRCLVEELSLT